MRRLMGRSAVFSSIRNERIDFLQKTMALSMERLGITRVHIGNNIN